LMVYSEGESTVLGKKGVKKSGKRGKGLKNKINMKIHKRLNNNLIQLPTDFMEKIFHSQKKKQ